jgi:hypothetical protein
MPSKRVLKRIRHKEIEYKETKDLFSSEKKHIKYKVDPDKKFDFAMSLFDVYKVFKSMMRYKTSAQNKKNPTRTIYRYIEMRKIVKKEIGKLEKLNYVSPGLNKLKKGECITIFELIELYEIKK